MLYYPHKLDKGVVHMATKAKTSSKARSAKTTRPASGAAARSAKKTTTVKSSAVKSRPAVAAPVVRQGSRRFTEDLSGSQVLGEMIGTFLLVAMVIASGGNAFLIGLGLVVIVMMFFHISGSHVNPAVTFGLFVMRKISAAKMVFYWMAQFVGAIAAILAVNAFSQSKLNISLASFTQWHWAVFSAEVIGAAIFMFGVAAAVNRAQTDSSKAVGIGLSLFVALLISSALLQQAVSAAGSQLTQDSTEQPRIVKLNGTTVNPAVALSQSETDSSNVNPMTGEPTGNASTPSRLTFEVILGTLLGAALGGRLYMLLSRDERTA